MALVSPAYTSEQAIVRLFSQQGVESHADHDQDGAPDAGVVNDCINRATAELDRYLIRWHTAATLAASTLVQEWACVMATVFLCRRRGNPVPESLAEDYAEILANLKELQLTGIPGLALNGNKHLPTMSNVTVDRRYPVSTIRVTPSNSTHAPTTLTQDDALSPIAYE